MAAGETGMLGQENVEESTEKLPSSTSYTLEVLQIIKESQSQHGLRHGDYQRYRQYCARRIRRIRKSLHFSQGTKHRVQPKKITDTILTDARYLYLPLVDAERSWAYAMQLKAEANTEPRKKFHMAQRLKKAVQHADLLASLCESEKCDARTKLEAQAYKSWMNGSLYFETENWKAAMEQFSNANTIYDKLGAAFVDEIKDIYQQRVEEISPNIRYCAYNIGDTSAIEDLRQMRLKTGREDPLTSRLDELIEKTREKQTSTLSEVTWRGRTVPVKNEQVRLFLLNVAETEQQLHDADSSESKLSILESLLKELIDAQQSLRDENKDDPMFKAIIRGQESPDKVPHSVFLHSYLVYLRQTKTVIRNLLMIESLKANLPGVRQDDTKKLTKPQDLARLYDIIIQSLSEVPNLPGLQDDSTLAQEIGTQVQGSKAFRCFYTAQTFASAKKWPEAIGLYERVLTYARDAIQGFKNLKDGSTNNTKEVGALEELIKEVDGLKYSCQAASILGLDDLNEPAAASAKPCKEPLSSRLDAYKEDPGLLSKKPNLTKFPPDFQPVAAKPLFFDLALSKVAFPSLEDKLEAKKQAGGISGFVKGWLWGGKK